METDINIIIIVLNNGSIKSYLNNELIKNNDSSINITTNCIEFEFFYKIKNNTYKFYLIKLITIYETKFYFKKFPNDISLKITNNSILKISQINHFPYKNLEKLIPFISNRIILKSLKFRNVILKIGDRKNDINFNNFLSLSYNENFFFILSKLTNNYKIIINNKLFFNQNGLIKSKDSNIEIDSNNDSKFNLHNYPVIEISKIDDKDIFKYHNELFLMGNFVEKVLFHHIQRFYNNKTFCYSGKTTSEKGIDLILIKKKIIYLFEAKCIKNNSFQLSKFQNDKLWYKNNFNSFIDFQKNLIENNDFESEIKLVQMMEFITDLERIQKSKKKYLLFSSIYFEVDKKNPTFLLIRKDFNKEFI